MLKLMLFALSEYWR